MILAAGDIVDLQFFLMDGAMRYVDAQAYGISAGDDLLASAAALDYVLLLSTERTDEVLDDEAPVTQSVRETMTRAALAALDLIERMRGAPAAAFADFTTRHVRPGGIFDVLAALRTRGVVRSNDVAFRLVTASSDIQTRLRAGEFA